MAKQVDNGEQTFLDMNGDPLSGGFVYMYVPDTNNFSPTWRDQAQTLINTNPIVLDQAGRAKIWGVDFYRQVVTDQFGNVQWDTITQGGIGESFEGDVSITGSLTVTNGLQVSGNLGVGGTSTLSGLLTANGGIHIPPGRVLNADGIIYANAGILSSGEIHIVAGQLLVADGVINANAGIVSSGDINIVAGQHLEVEGGILTDSIQPIGSGTNVQFLGDIVVEDPGKHIHIVSGDNPCFSFGNTSGGGTNFGMWNAGTFIDWGITDPVGEPTTNLMSLHGSGVGTGSLSVSGDILPFVHEGGNLGQNTMAWNNVVAHNYITVSTDAASPEVEEGMLEVVRGVPVKTEPHLGIAADDLKGIDWAQVEGGGVSYNMLVGALWKALQELDAKFDAYVAAHP